MTQQNENNKPIEAAAFTAGGAVAGGVVASTVGGMGLAVGGTAFSIGAAPVVAAGAVVGLAAYGLKQAFDTPKETPDPTKAKQKGIHQVIADRVKANLDESKRRKWIEDRIAQNESQTYGRRRKH